MLMQVDRAASDGEGDPSPVQGLVTGSSPATHLNTAPSVDLSSPSTDQSTPGYYPLVFPQVLHLFILNSSVLSVCSGF